MLSLAQAGGALGTLAVFRSLLDDPVLSAFQKLCLSQGAPAEKASLCGAFCAALYQETTDFPGYVLGKALEAETPYVKRQAMGKEIPEALADTLKSELEILEKASSFTVEQVKQEIKWEGSLPGAPARLDQWGTSFFCCLSGTNGSYCPAGLWDFCQSSYVYCDGKRAGAGFLSGNGTSG